MREKKDAITARERVRATLNRTETDRPPNDLGGCEIAALHVLAYANVRKALGLPERAVKVHTLMYKAVFDEDALAAIHGDIPQAHLHAMIDVHGALL